MWRPTAHRSTTPTPSSTGSTPTTPGERPSHGLARMRPKTSGWTSVVMFSGSQSLPSSTVHMVTVVGRSPTYQRLNRSAVGRRFRRNGSADSSCGWSARAEPRCSNFLPKRTLNSNSTTSQARSQATSWAAMCPMGQTSPTTGFCERCGGCAAFQSSRLTARLDRGSNG